MLRHCIMEEGMASEDDRKIHPRPAMVGRGLGATADQIQDLQRRHEAHGKTLSKVPEVSFDEVLERKSATASEEEESAAQEDETDPTLEKPPRPGLQHPTQADGYGREKDPVVIKG